MDGTDVGARLAAVRARISAAEQAAGRTPGSVRLLLATKTVPPSVVRTALEADADRPAGTRPVLLGENRVQEATVTAAELADLAPELHLIGPLQSNKVNQALRAVCCVETVATLELAERLASRCEAGRVLDVMVQVNVSGEPTKAGVPPQEARDLALAVGRLSALRLTGFMTVGAHSADQAVVRSGYADLRALRDAVVGSGAPGTAEAVELSMGMSADLEAAVAEGASIVRLGSAVFGSRPPA